MIAILLADDQHLVRSALAALLRLQPDFAVVAEVGDGVSAVDAARDNAPDIALLDIEMPGMDGLAATSALRTVAPATRTLILTTFGRPGYLQRAIDSGAWGFVVKDSPPDRLADAIRRVHAGQRVVDPALAATSLQVGPNPLTPRERDVLREVESGGTVVDIAGRLGLSGGTTRNHLSAAIGKTAGGGNRAEAAAVARRNGWL